MAKYAYEQFAATRLIRQAVQYSPDGSRIAYIDNTSGQFNLWAMPSGGGYARQLTVLTDLTIRDFDWSPDGKNILFLADRNSDEQTQLYLISADGGWPEKLTHNDNAQHQFGRPWSPDGKFIAYTANNIEPTNMQVIIRNMQTDTTTRPIEGQGFRFPAFWSRDARYLTAIDFRSNTDQSILLINIETGEVTDTTPHEGEVIFFPGLWYEDGFYIITNQGREFSNLAFYSLEKGSWEWVETPDHDIEQGNVQGDVTVWAQNENGTSKIYGRNLKTGQSLRLPDLPLGVISGMDLSLDATRLAMVFARPTAATALYEVNLKTGETTALTQSMLGGIDPADMIEPELIEYETFDDKKIPAWLYRPKNASADEPVPMLLSIHGGPEAQERPVYNYNGFYQYLLSRGFGILVSDIRGSVGYGISYQKLIYRDWGGDELTDIEHAAKFMQSLDWVDSHRLAVFGGSFGGFATLSAVSRLPEYWAAAVDIVGPANLVTFTKSVPPHWRRFMKLWIGDPEDEADVKFMLERSPITYVEQIKAPMLIIQGANDPRVVQAESDRMVEKLREMGNEVKYYVDEEEGHGASRRENAIKWNKMAADFLTFRLLNESAE